MSNINIDGSDNIVGDGNFVIRTDRLPAVMPGPDSDRGMQCPRCARTTWAEDPKCHWCTYDLAAHFERIDARAKLKRLGRWGLLCIVAIVASMIGFASAETRSTAGTLAAVAFFSSAFLMASLTRVGDKLEHRIRQHTPAFLRMRKRQ